MENVVFDEHTREVDYFDKSVTGIKFEEKHYIHLDVSWSWSWVMVLVLVLVLIMN
mgnify:CR=1 FL=1